MPKINQTLWVTRFAALHSMNEVDLAHTHPRSHVDTRFYAILSATHIKSEELTRRSRHPLFRPSLWISRLRSISQALSILHEWLFGIQRQPI
jgi:hypothetical protein